jgi:hypothetical protein
MITNEGQLNFDGPISMMTLSLTESKSIKIAISIENEDIKIAIKNIL